MLARIALVIGVTIITGVEANEVVAPSKGVYFCVTTGRLAPRGKGHTSGSCAAK